MNLQPLYDVKERLEAAAIAGTGLLEEDFRLRRAAEALHPLSAASPVFGKIDSGLAALLSAPTEERPGMLLDLLALVDAVAYTQARTGAEGQLEPLPAGGGTYQQIAHSQLQPLVTALTTTGGGRMEVIQSAWESHPEYFSDYRVLPCLVAGLGDSYGEIAELNANILKGLGPVAIPLLREGFDPAGKREMARRVEVSAALEGPAATPWLREILPAAKKEVRPAVIAALGGDPANRELLLELAKGERGRNREAVLEALARQEGADIRAFWTSELAKNEEAVSFLAPALADWASDLVAVGLREQLERLLSGLASRQDRVAKEDGERLGRWLRSARGKSSPDMLELWRWTDGQLERLNRLKNHIGQPYLLAGQISECLLEGVYLVRQGPLCQLCIQLHQKDPGRSFYLPHSFTAAVLTCPPGEVYDRFSPYLLTRKPLLDSGSKRSCHEAMLRALLNLRLKDGRLLDRRWTLRLLDAVWKDMPGKQTWYNSFPNGAPLGSFEATLLGLADERDEEHCRAVSAYFLGRMTDAADWYTYGRLALRFHGNPRQALEQTLRRSVKPMYLYHIWDFCAQAALSLPAEDTAAMLDLFLGSGRIRREDAALAEKAVPYTAAALREGRPFPEWSQWWSMQ